MNIGKDKALELVNKFHKYSYNGEDNLDNRNAKECAKICVQEIILSNPHSNPFNTDQHSTMDYWLKVKNEIELI